MKPSDPSSHVGSGTGIEPGNLSVGNAWVGLDDSPNRKNSITKRNQGDLYLLTSFFFWGGGGGSGSLKRRNTLLFFFRLTDLFFFEGGGGGRQTKIIWRTCEILWKKTNDGKRCFKVKAPKETFKKSLGELFKFFLLKETNYDTYIYIIIRYTPPKKKTNESPLKNKGVISKKERIVCSNHYFFPGTFVSFQGRNILASGILGGAPSHISRFSKLRSFFGSVLTTPHNEAINFC